MKRLRLCLPLLACTLLVGLLPAAAPAATRRLGERTLRLGATGSDVTALQALLTKAGYAVPADGRFGPGTRSALMTFQRAAHRQTTGTAGPGTIKVLKAAVKAAGAAAPASGSTGGAAYGDGARPAPAAGPAPAAAPAQTAPVTPAAPSGPRGTATLRPDGTAVAPPDAPAAVVAMIAAGNRIATLPYRYGGGHGSFDDTAYDCSGSISFALHGADLLDRTMVSGEFETFGVAGPGRWVTTYANGGHLFMIVAGLRFDTSGLKQTGSRWQTAKRSDEGFVVRHPAGL